MHRRIARETLRPLFVAWLALAAASPLALSAQAAGARQDLASGRVHYIASCARCHGVDGGGGEGPPLARAQLPRAPDDPSLIRIMRYGISGTAMSGSSWLSPTELAQVAAYVRSLAPADATADHLPGDATRGEALYERERCANCHTLGGFGTARGPDLTTIGLRRSVAYLREAIVDPAAALPRGQSVMPRAFIDYLPVSVVDADGSQMRGARVNEDTYSIQLRDASGRIHSFYKPSLRSLEKQFDRSLMRSYRASLTDEEVDDLVAYLTTLTGAAPRLSS